MANVKHLKILRRGVENWNAWRRTHPETVLDLSEATLGVGNLSGVDLSGVNLRRSMLAYANLSRANLRGAKLREANFGHADLCEANLRGAELNKSDFSDAKLCDADLTDSDLNGAILWSADLQRADLRRVDTFGSVNFIGANLSYANLGYANFRFADFINAKLVAANLNSTDLKYTNFSHADLSQADLSNADLKYANFQDSICTCTNLINSRFGSTSLANLDLSSVVGLELANHSSPSSISIDTIYRSKGQIPEAFLRGCGVPDSLIMHARALIEAEEGIQFYSCFISYSSLDEEFARRLHGRLQQDHVRVWFAPHDVQGGRKLHEQIDEAIKIYDKLLILLSPTSLKSNWVMTELRKARKAERKTGKRKLFPVRLVDYDTLQEWECFDADGGQDLAVEVREYFIPDFTHWKAHDAFEIAYARLLKDLRTETQAAKI